jgi:hypothetical protein
LTLGQNASLCSPAVSGLCPNLYTDATINTIWNVADNDDFSFTDGAGNDTACTILFLAYPELDSLYAQACKYNSTGDNCEWLIYVSGGILITRFTSNTAAVEIKQSTNASLPAGWSCFGITYDGSETDAGIISYVNGVAVAQTAGGSGGYTGMTRGTCNVMNAYNATSGRSKGRFGVMLIINKALTAAEVSRLSKRLLAYAGLFQ